jgi:capsular exopolysaccharide synthesis family protein
VTFRQIIDVLWQRKWLIVAVIVVAMISAAAYLQLQVRTYASTVEVRTSAIVTNAASGGELDGVQVDFDPSTLTAPKVVDAVAAATGSSTADIAKSLSYSLVAGKSTNVIDLTAVASTAAMAQDRANAVVKVYTAYLQTQINSALKTMTARQVAANQLAIQYQQQTIANPRDAIAASNLANALGQLATLNSQIQSLNNSGSPITLLTTAPLGSPQGPGMGIVLAIAFSAGLIAGIGIALIRDQFDNRLRGESEIELLTGVPSLGELAFDKSLRRTRETLPAASRDQTPLSEGLRSLRTSIQVLLPREHAVLVLTSVEPGDGKSFITANLGLAWARAGKKVIVVGGDLRRPSLSTYFHEPSDGAGLSDILRDATKHNAPSIATQVDRHLANTTFHGLRVLPAGSDADDPADLLATASFREVVEVLRSRSDIVIFDSPPAMALIDASLLAEYADGVVVLASLHRTDRTSLATTVDLLRQNGATILGVASNHSRRKVPKTYSGYYIQPGSKDRAIKSAPAAETPPPVTKTAARKKDTPATTPGSRFRPPEGGSSSAAAKGQASARTTGTRRPAPRAASAAKAQSDSEPE